MSKIRQAVVVNGEKRKAVETFRACGVKWIRYKRADGSNGYATAAEWAQWRGKTPTE